MGASWALALSLRTLMLFLDWLGRQDWRRPRYERDLLLEVITRQVRVITGE